MASLSVWRKRKQVEKARRERIAELMREYDATVFYPALEAIKVECAAAGHGTKHYHNNGLGWVFTSCSACGAMLAKDGPEWLAEESLEGEQEDE